MTESPEERAAEVEPSAAKSLPVERPPAAKSPTPKPMPPKSRPARNPLPSPLPVITTALGLFLVVLTLLAIQVRNGRDPALGPGPAIPVISQPGVKGAATQATTIVSRTSPAPPP
ncbi:MAG: hypothetical protein WBM00_11910 [Solirubrobacterales bacterium]